MAEKGGTGRGSFLCTSVLPSQYLSTDIRYRYFVQLPRGAKEYYRGADKSLARPTSRCIFYDGENISFDASLVIYINSTNIPPIMIMNRIYENQNLLSLYLVIFLVELRTYQHPCTVQCQHWQSQHNCSTDCLTRFPQDLLDGHHNSKVWH